MNPNKIIIRDATVTDIKSLVKLLEQLFSIEKDFIFSAEKQEKGLWMMLDGCGKHRTIKVAQCNASVVGMCSVQTRISTAQGNMAAIVEDLVVDSEFINMGIGKMLLKAVFSWTRKRGITNLQLLADKYNQDALGFYERQNWDRTRLICFTKTLVCKV